MCDRSPGPQGAWSVAADTAAVDMEREWGPLAISPQGLNAASGHSADGERPLPLHTVLVSCDCAGMFTSCLL